MFSGSYTIIIIFLEFKFVWYGCVVLFSNFDIKHLWRWLIENNRNIIEEFLKIYELYETDSKVGNIACSCIYIVRVFYNFKVERSSSYFFTIRRVKMPLVKMSFTCEMNNLN